VLDKTEGQDVIAGYKDTLNIFLVVLYFELLLPCKISCSFSSFDSMMDEKKVPNGIAVTPATPDIADGELETQGYSVLSTKTLLRKLDWHIIPFMSLIYLYA